MQINKDKKEISIDYVTEGNSICKSETLFSNPDINIRLDHEVHGARLLEKRRV